MLKDNALIFTAHHVVAIAPLMIAGRIIVHLMEDVGVITRHGITLGSTLNNLASLNHAFKGLSHNFLVNLTFASLTHLNNVVADF